MRYFGPCEGLPLTTHHDLQANLVQFAERKGLEGSPTEMLSKADALTAEFALDHDFHVVLRGERKVMVASVWARTGDAGTWPLGDSYGGDIAPIVLSDLFQLIEEYIEAVASFIDTNRASRA